VPKDGMIQCYNLLWVRTDPNGEWARRQQTKGKVESAVRFVKDNFMVARRFTDLADLNRQARAWCHEIDQRIHGTTGERPCDLLSQEQLLPLPSPDRLMKFMREERKVSMDGFVSYDGVRYGVRYGVP
jgi:hypothetical protein